MEKVNYTILSVLLLCQFFMACSVQKYIPDDRMLYTGAEVEIDTIGNVDDYDEIEYVLEGLPRPEPNGSILGIRPGLYFHFRAARDSGWIYQFLDRKMGEKPVYLSDVEVSAVEQLMNNRLVNRGHFFNLINSDIQQNPQKKTASVLYRVRVPEYYSLKTYQFEGDSLVIQRKIQDYKKKESVFQEGIRFDLARMKLERERIDGFLKNDGYYNFNPDFLHFAADTNRYSGRNYDLFLHLKKDVPDKALIPYRIKEINVYPGYQMGQDSMKLDTVRFNNKNYIGQDLYFKPDKLDPFIRIEEGDYYHPGRSKSTSRRLGSTGAYKFVNIQYEETDSMHLDSVGSLQANIYLSPLNRRGVRAELQAVTKSNNFSGPSLALTYTNRNLFRGGEVLDITANAGYETQFSKSKEPGLNSLQLSLTGDLVFPRVILPIPINNDWFDYSIPKTRVSLGGEFISRTELFKMSSVLATYGFFWSGNKFVTHELDPVSITYLNLLNSTPEFEDILDRNPFLQSSFDQRFISGMTYSYTYNGMVDQQQKHQFYLNGSFDVAGNLLSLITGKREGPPQTFLGLEYAQYAKGALDIRYHIDLGRNQKLASRIYGGLGEAYGNSDVMPYSKQFYSGGPYSVRAFNTRKLGPGTYDSGDDENDNATYFDQTGNLRLEANIEYRFPLFSYLRGALFIDAGNVWITNENEALPGGQFGKDFLSELGIGIGIGLRLDIQSFVIRVDLAAPMHDPREEPGKRWVYDFDSPVLNLAVGYPF